MRSPTVVRACEQLGKDLRDFQIESRKRPAEMAVLLDICVPTYYNWLRGGMKEKDIERIRAILTEAKAELTQPTPVQEVR